MKNNIGRKLQIIETAPITSIITMYVVIEVGVLKSLGLKRGIMNGRPTPTRAVTRVMVASTDEENAGFFTALASASPLMRPNRVWIKKTQNSPRATGEMERLRRSLRYRQFRYIQ